MLGDAAIKSEAGSALAEAARRVVGRLDRGAMLQHQTRAAAIADTFARLDAAAVNPSIPESIAQELKFSECLPAELAAEVVEARLSDREGIRATLARVRRIVVDTC